MSGDSPESQIGVIYEFYFAQKIAKSEDESAILRLQDREDVTIICGGKNKYYQLKYHSKTTTESITWSSKKSGLTKVICRMFEDVDNGRYNSNYYYVVCDPKWAGSIDTDREKLKVAFLAAVCLKHNNKAKIGNIANYSSDAVVALAKKYIEDMSDDNQYYCFLSGALKAVTESSSEHAKCFDRLVLESSTDQNFINQLDDGTTLRIGIIIQNYTKLSRDGMTIKEYEKALSQYTDNIVVKEIMDTRVGSKCHIELCVLSRTKPYLPMSVWGSQRINLIRKYESMIVSSLANQERTGLSLWLDKLLYEYIDYADDKISATYRYAAYLHLLEHGNKRSHTPNPLMPLKDTKFVSGLKKRPVIKRKTRNVGEEGFIG